MEPAHSIITKLGGPSKVANYVGVHRTRVSNWMRSKEQGGTGGTIPARHFHRVMQMANEMGVEVDVMVFVPHAEATA